jgi:hypothetical protein
MSTTPANVSPLQIRLVAWCSSARYGFGAWHRVAGTRTACGIRIPAGVRMSRRVVGTSTRPADTCQSCWPTIGAAAAEASARWSRWILTAFAKSLRAQLQRLEPASSAGGALASALRRIAAELQADAEGGHVDGAALLRLGAEQYVIRRYVHCTGT